MDDTLKFIVPNRRVGLIIGPRGAHIAELQQKSGARISVDKESRTENEVTIKGAQAAVATAKEMIDDMIAKQEQEERDSAARHTASRAPQGGGAAAHTYGNRMGMGGPSPPPGLRLLPFRLPPTLPFVLPFLERERGRGRNGRTPS